MQQPVSAGFPLSLQQRNLWTWQADNEPFIAEVQVEIRGPVDAPKLRSALEQVVARHEILRTSFQRSAGMKYPFQVVNAIPAVKWLESGATAKWDLEQLPAVEALLAREDDHHVLTIRVPALSADPVSLVNIVSELHGFYTGTIPAADPLQYADYSEWQSELLQGQDPEATSAREYWSRHDFASIPPVALPFERKSSAGSGFLPAFAPVCLHEKVIEQIGKLPDPCAFLLSAWQVLLWRVSGQAEIKIGYVSDGRGHEELRHAVGMFAKTIPLYSNFANDHSFAAVVQESTKAVNQAVEHQDYHDDPGDLGASFSIVKLPTLSAGQVCFAVRAVSSADHSPIQLRCTHRENRWTIQLAHDANRFSAHSAELLAKRVAILLTAAVQNPDTAISELPIMDAAERQQITVKFNETAADFPRAACIHYLFEQQAARTPDRPALRFGEQWFTYGELNARANQIAHLLRTRGVKANVPVGLCVERSAEMIVGLLAILKAGGCYVPLVPDNPKSRLAHQLSETGAPVVLTEEKLLSRLPECTAICLDRDCGLFDQQPSSNPEHTNSPDDLVYVIYTSGSTGVPKGVAVRHFNLINYSHFMCQRLKLDASEPLNFATVSTLSADLGNTCIFPSLISGGCLHVIGYETAMAANLFAEYARKHAIDVLKITPSHLASLLNAADSPGVLPRKYLVLGGEASSWDLLDRIHKVSKCAVINHYGPTEATVGCCTFAVAENDIRDWSPATVPIGRPIANDEIYILDQRFRPLPVGVAGELCIGGMGLAKGYLNQPQQTAERFVAHPFSKDPNAQLYRTGDLARFLPEGNVEFLGRIDHQVKIRGFRVEPAEIEAALKQHSAVKQPVIVPYDDSGEKRLAAYLVMHKQVSTEELRSFLLTQLPEYMVPSAFVILDSLPLNANGKVDLRTLPSPDQAQAKTARDFVAARTVDEEKLVAIWTEVLKLDQVSIADNFFELGGHSLLATQIISRIRNSFRVQMPLHSFLETPTIGGLAEKIPHCPSAETEEEEMARLLQELEGISDEEAVRLLAATDGDGTSEPAK